MTDDTACHSRRVRMMQLIRVAEHLEASSPSPPSWPCTCVHGPKKPSRHTMKAVAETSAVFCTSGPHDHQGHVTVQIHLPLFTATLVFQLEPGKVVVVSANIVNVAEPAIQHANTTNELLVLKILEKFSVIGFTLSQTAS